MISVEQALEKILSNVRVLEPERKPILERSLVSSWKGKQRVSICRSRLSPALPGGKK